MRSIKTYEELFWWIDIFDIRKEILNTNVEDFCQKYWIWYAKFKQWFWTKADLIKDFQMLWVKKRLYNVETKHSKRSEAFNLEVIDNINKCKNKFWLSDEEIKELLFDYTFSEILQWKIIKWKLVISNIIKLYEC